MASPAEVKNYLAYWFQLGKRVVLYNGKQVLSPQPVIQGDHYSAAFEDCWQKILDCNGKDCYLENTDQTLEQLFSPEWIISPCYRCEMPVPVRESGNQCLLCPCNDLENWPNTELPQPRSPVDSKKHLSGIQKRLHQMGDKPQSDHSQNCAYNPKSPGLRYAMRIQERRQQQKQQGTQPTPPNSESSEHQDEVEALERPTPDQDNSTFTEGETTPAQSFSRI
ncbi:hypothetical protein PN462_08935 [Spirulina sp. CS-785/01]|uniref:hypothetical protein n=1 Tax=Spirulina sp. CS-785/01 TaxID=3021716 RepID=UPI00232D4C4F|nr:hypothetical protein [Spirulina sp. CS-785/01]MDB9313222.1 hypothetical protein [Spirulina sp. CS-785/01]